MAVAPIFFRADGWVKTSIGPAIPGSQIFIVQQPFPNVPGSLTFSNPTPQQQLYSDPNGLFPITQPILTDGLGHYDFYVLPGTYTLLVYLNGVLQNQYADQSIGLAGGINTGTGLVLTGGTISLAPRVAAITYVIDGGGSVPGTGAKGQMSIPFSCTVTGWVLTSDVVSGSAVVDVLRASYANFPSTVTIANTDKPTLVSVQKNENLAVSAWTTAINAGDLIQFNLNSVTTATRLNLSINVTIP